MRSSWERTFYACFAAQFLAMMGFSFVLPFLPYYLTTDLGLPDELAVTARWSGILMAAVGFSMAICAPFWGILSDRYGRKPMLMRSLFGGAVVIALMGCAQNVWQLLILRLLQGALTGTVAASLALVASVTPRERTGRAIGLIQAAVFGGISVGPFAGGYTAAHLGFRPTFYVAAALLLISGMLVKVYAEEEFLPVSHSEAKKAGGYVELFGVAGFAIAVLAIFQIHFANNTPNPIFPQFVRHLTQTTIQQATPITGKIESITGMVACLGTWYFGRLSDRWGHKRMLVTSALCASVLVFPQPFARNIGQLYALRILFGLAMAGMLPSANAIIREITPERHIGRAFGTTSCMAGMAFFLGPLIGGYLAAHANAFWPPFAFCSVVLLLTAVLAAWKIPSVSAACALPATSPSDGASHK